MGKGRLRKKKKPPKNLHFQHFFGGVVKVFCDLCQLLGNPLEAGVLADDGVGEGPQPIVKLKKMATFFYFFQY